MTYVPKSQRSQRKKKIMQKIITGKVTIDYHTFDISDHRRFHRTYINWWEGNERHSIVIRGKPENLTGFVEKDSVV